MPISQSRVTLHMAASLDGFIARKDGRVDWMETVDEFAGGETMDPHAIEAFLQTIDCYVMGSRTYETALQFEAKGLGWPYGEKPTFVLSSRPLPRHRENVVFYSGDLAAFVNQRLRPTYRSIWFVGGGTVFADCLRLNLADEIRYSVLPIAIGEGSPFFAPFACDIPLHLLGVKAYRNGIVELHYQVKGKPAESLSTVS
ncbi:MAG: dihydrofolate reductase family protein [Gemmataceae bacterium]